jgi:glycerol transport system ATP-binding protein
VGTQLKQLHREFGHTMIYVTHDQTEALTFADKVVVMHEGRVVQVGTPEELIERPGHTFVGYFIGSPGMNLLKAEVAGTTARIAGHEVPLGGTYATTDGAVKIGIRPEYVRLGTDEGVPVTVTGVEDVGRHRIVRADLDGTPISAVVPEHTPLPADANRAVFEPAQIGVFVDDWRVEPVAVQPAEEVA